MSEQEAIELAETFTQALERNHFRIQCEPVRINQGETWGVFRPGCFITDGSRIESAVYDQVELVSGEITSVDSVYLIFGHTQAPEYDEDEA